MARKAKAPARPAPAAAPGAGDLDVLHPDRSATIAGRQVRVREYGFVEGLKLRPILQPFLDDLHAVVIDAGIPQLDHIVALLGEHADAIAHAVAVAADVEQQWLAGLNQDDGMNMLMLWWGANGPFYVRSVFSRIATDREVARLRAGPTSTPASSPPATDALRTSAE